MLFNFKEPLKTQKREGDRQMENQILAMRFSHENGMVPAWNLASDFSGQNGRIATLPDIADARIENDYMKPVWNTFYTTLSAEYVGIGKNGRLLLIVAHGIGPMSTIEGIQKAYSYSYKDVDRQKRGGRISQEEFLNLEAEMYGEVAIVDLEDYMQSYQYPFMQTLPEDSEELDSVVRARFGIRYAEYIARCRLNSAMWINDPREGNDRRKNLQTLTVEAGDISYFHEKPEEGLAFAHLLSVGGLSNVHHEHGISLMHDVTCHDWTDGTALAGIRETEKITNVHPGFNYRRAVKNPNSRKALMVKTDKVHSLNKMSTLSKIDDKVWFTQTQKIGVNMDTGILLYPVSSIVPIGESVTFRTKISGYQMFVRYGLSEVRSVAPENANAYCYINAEIIWENKNPEYHEIQVQFYRIEADTSERIMREDEITRDANLLESIVNLYS
jgi:hypothetical protein